jgi:HD-like signal output (HDOD) protein
MPTARKLVESCETLMTLPEIFLRVRQVIENQHSSMDELAAALALDPSMTARVLHAVNSPFYGVPRKIETLTQAVNLLGMRPIEHIVFATSVAQTFTKLPPSVMTMAEYWRKSVLCALFARRLARAAGLPDSDRLFVAGLLRDVGHLVLYQTVPDRAQAALVEAMNLNLPVADVERDSIGCDYAEVGAELIKTWDMPLQLEQAVRYQLTPERAGEVRQEAAVLYTAGLLADHLDRHGLDAAVPHSVGRAASDLLGLAAEELHGIAEEVLSQLQHTLSLIYPKGAALAA